MGSRAGKPSLGGTERGNWRGATGLCQEFWILRDRNEISDAIREDVRTSAQSYGVEIRRADVKDLVFPGNLREIMNKVIETERECEAGLIAASNRAEIAQIEAEAQARTMQQRLETEEKAARLLSENSQLLRLRELEVLREIGMRGGNSFYIGLEKLIERLPDPPKPSTQAS